MSINDQRFWRKLYLVPEDVENEGAGQKSRIQVSDCSERHVGDGLIENNCLVEIAESQVLAGEGKMYV